LGIEDINIKIDVIINLAINQDFRLKLQDHIKLNVIGSINLFNFA